VQTVSPDRIISPQSLSPEEDRINWTLRPKTLKELIGQRELVGRLQISLEAARLRNEPLEHVLLHGPPGLGKTTLAHIIAGEMGSRLVQASGPTLVRAADLIGILTNLKAKDVLFIDEVHRMPVVVEEFLYPAMEDFKIDIPVDKGPYARMINVPLKRFTLVAATTRAGLLSSPLRERFGIFHHVDFYPVEELVEIVARSARMLSLQIDSNALMEVARRSRGTPRVANRLLRRVRDYTQARSTGHVSRKIADQALAIEGIDSEGLTLLDRKYLTAIIEYYDAGPVGVEAIAATLNEETDTLVDVVEPYLLKVGFIIRTPKGRKATPRACEHLGLEPGRDAPGTKQKGLFEEQD